jgi:hypothetical protein
MRDGRQQQQQQARDLRRHANPDRDPAERRRRMCSSTSMVRSYIAYILCRCIEGNKMYIFCMCTFGKKTIFLGNLVLFHVLACMVERLLLVVIVRMRIL